MKYSINIKNTYLVLMIVLGLIALSTYSTYALFSDNLKTNELVSISAIELKIGIKDFNTYSQIDLSPYEKKSVLIKLNNSTNSLNYYKIWYKMVNPSQIDDFIKVKKSSKSTNNTNGTINSNNTLEIELTIINYSNAPISLNLGVNNSLENNIELEANKNEILDIDENNSENKIWSTENNDFEEGKCTLFSLQDKPSGIYKIELLNSNNYISGSLFLDDSKDLYVCVGKKGLGKEHSQIMISKPNKEWYYDDDLINKLFLVNSEKKHILTKSKYKLLIDTNDKYKIDNSDSYFIKNEKIINQTIDSKEADYIKITLEIPYQKIDRNITIDKLFIDGNISSYPTTGTYYLSEYTCDYTTTNLTWNNDNYTLSSNGDYNDTCNIYLTTNNRYLYSAKQGDYVNYIGIGGIANNKEIKCSTEECNAKVNSCGNDKYNNFGWRIAYIIKEQENLIPYLISTSITDCTNTTDIDTLNELSLKYCNESYIYGNNCNKDIGSVNIWNINNKDYERILSNGKTIDICNNLNYIDNKCGYTNELINIDGTYSIINNNSLLYFNKTNNGVNSQINETFGIRTIIKLDPKTKIISGNGTKEQPYNICLGEEC